MNHWRHVEEGVLLVATGERHRQEAILAVPRIRPNLSGRPIWLICDEPKAIPAKHFDRVLSHPQPRHCYRDKILPLLRLPFKRTLFLDTDVQLLNPVDDMFSLLQVLDVVGCHAPVRWCQWSDPEVPEGFCELNSGVLGFRRSRLQRRMVRRWITTYDRIQTSFDQASLRSALWWAVCQGLRCWVLPTEYNLRTTKPWMTGQDMPVKILHGRIPNEMRTPLADYLNSDINTFRSSTAFPTRQNAAIASWPKVNPLRLFILGAGRSGTSLVAGLFRNAGLYMGDSHYLPRQANPLGFFEDREVNAINEDLMEPWVDEMFDHGQHWLAPLPLNAVLRASPDQLRRIRVQYAQGPSCLKDPRFCYTLHAWRDQLSNAERQEARYICVFRHPSVVVTSMLQELREAPYLQSLLRTPEQLLLAWELQYRHVLEHHQHEGHWLFLHYESLFETAGLDRLATFTGLCPDRKFVNPALRRSHANVTTAEACDTLYAKLLKLASENP